MRVSELAKELNLTSKEVIEKLAQIKIVVKTHSSSVTEDQIKKLKDFIAGGSVIEVKKPKAFIVKKAKADEKPEVKVEEKVIEEEKVEKEKIQEIPKKVETPKVERIERVERPKVEVVKKAPVSRLEIVRHAKPESEKTQQIAKTQKTNKTSAPNKPPHPPSGILPHYL